MNKIFLFSTCCIVIVLNLHAQNTTNEGIDESNVHSQKEWFPIGAEWYYEWGNSMNSFMPIYKRQYFVEKDTVIEGKTCRIINGENNQYMGITKYIVYEENGIVYYYFNNGFRKIYDFSVNEGDTVEFEFLASVNYTSSELDTTLIVPCLIEKITSKFVNGIELKEVHASCSSTIYVYLGSWYPLPVFGNYQYLEKVGCESPGKAHEGFIPFIVNMGIALLPEETYRFRCYHDAEIDYMADWWKLQNKPCDYEFRVSNSTIDYSKKAIKVYPNPVIDRLTVSGEAGQTRKVTIVLYDAVGRVVMEKKEHLPCELFTGEMPQGIYYINIFDDTLLLTSKIIKL